MKAMPLQILLIEDDLAEAELVRRMLGQARAGSFRVEHEECLQAGLERLAEGRFDALLLDFNLPDSAGLETFETARQAVPGIPIVVLTNVNDQELAARAVREGAQDFLVKREVDGALLGRALRYAIERQQSEQALRDSEQRYALAVAGAKDGLWDWDLAADSIYYSPRWKAMLGYAENEIGSGVEEWLGRIHTVDRPEFDAALAAHFEARSEHFEHEYRMRTQSGELLWVLSRGLTVRDAAGEPCRMAGSMTDLSSRKLAEEQLLYDAMHDALTGLPNRALFVDRLSVALKHRRRMKESDFAVVFLDLDRFKNINDSHGHAFGDKLLTLVARRLLETLRDADTVARLGGDEFALLLNDVSNVGEATMLAERIQNGLQQKFVIDGHVGFTSASMGIALSSTGYVGPTDMLRDADIAMYRAKAAGKARCEVFDHDMHKSAVALLKLETDLRLALRERQFVVHYQPIVALDTERPLGFEALVRWRHPTRGLISPQKFISVAEETGLIVPLGWWVLEQACRQIRHWQQRFPMDPPLSISINVSGRLFREEGMVERLISLLEESCLDPSSLQLEITENIVLDHADEVLAVLSQIRALGVGLHIDDFGTGYSALSYLQRFDYDTLKIDRSFISVQNPHEGLSPIVQAIVSLGNHLRMNVIAEGVETAEQARLLREIDCPQAQGFWFAKPLATFDVETMLAEQLVMPS